MGLRFDLQIANWLAHVLDERLPIPTLGNEWQEREALGQFLSKISKQFYSTPWGQHNFSQQIERARQLSQDEPIGIALKDLRRFLADRPWTALLVPSASDTPANRLMCSEDFLRELIFIRPNDPGLVLQLETVTEQVFSLIDVFPAFRTALAESTDWPGVLVWKQTGDSVFLPLADDSTERLERQARWIFSHLGTMTGVDLELLKDQYRREFLDVPSKSSKRVTILQLSDIHLGCREASIRMPRIQTILANLINDLGEINQSIIPLVSGDLMDTPDEDNLDRVRSFLGMLKTFGTEEPIVLLGNHDVRKDGFLSEDFRLAMQVDSVQGAVKWFDDFKLGVACFDSVRGGKLARGKIGERQFLDMGSNLDELCRGQSGQIVIAALHHHPMPVELPAWYARPFYERIIGGAYDKTEELEDAGDFISFVEQRQFAAVLHGHKHIPRVDETPQGIPVIGCGSSVGKVATNDKRLFMSINLLSINRSTGKIAARLLAERIAGGGLSEYKAHEIVWSPQTAKTYRAH